MNILLAALFASLSVTVMPAMRAYDFYSKWGVNGTPDGPGNMFLGLQTTHLKRIRLGVYNDFSWATTLAQGGVKLHLMMTWYNTPAIPVSQRVQGLKNIVPTYPGTVETVGGPNE